MFQSCHGGHTSLRPRSRGGEDIVLSVWDSDWSQPCKSLCSLSQNPSGHHRRNSKTSNGANETVNVEINVSNFRWQFSSVDFVRDISNLRVNGSKQRWRAENWWPSASRDSRGWRRSSWSTPASSGRSPTARGSRWSSRSKQKFLAEQFSSKHSWLSTLWPIKCVRIVTELKLKITGIVWFRFVFYQSLLILL